MPNPFGVELGSTPSSRIASYTVNFSSIPKAHPDLKEYVGVWRPDEGLVRLLALSDIFENDPSGNAALRVYSRVKTQLEQIYGNGEVLEYLEPQSVYNDPSDFLDGIRIGERGHSTMWGEEYGSRLDADIRFIVLSIDSEGYDASRVTLSYDKFLPNHKFSDFTEAGFDSL